MLALFPARVKELGASAKTDLARGCGYVVKKKDGDEQVKFTQFEEALLQAEGLTFYATAASGADQGGRKLSGIVKGQEGAGQWKSLGWQGVLRDAGSSSWQRVRYSFGKKANRLISIGGGEKGK